MLDLNFHFFCFQWKLSISLFYPYSLDQIGTLFSKNLVMQKEVKLCNSVTDCLAQVCSATQVSLVVRKLPSHRDLLTLLSRASRWGTHDDLALMMTMTLRMSAVISQPHPQR